MKIRSLILVLLASFFLGQFGLNAQQVEHRYAKTERKTNAGHRKDPNHDRNENDHKVRKLGKQNKHKAKNFKSNRRVAKADGKITRDERRQMKREAKRYNGRGNRRAK